MPAYDNMAVAAKLDLTAALLELSGADKFRFLSYGRRRAPSAPGPSRSPRCADEGRLTEVPGVGAKMAANIEQIVDRGSFAELDDVSADDPAHPRRGHADPRGRARSGPRCCTSGWASARSTTSSARWPTTPSRRFAASGARPPSQHRRGRRDHAPTQRAHAARRGALPVAEQLVREVAAAPRCRARRARGQLRRREETIGDIDLLASSARARRGDRGVHRAARGRARAGRGRHEGERRAARRAAGRRARGRTASSTARRCSTSPATRSTTSSCASSRRQRASR